MDIKGKDGITREMDDDDGRFVGPGGGSGKAAADKAKAEPKADNEIIEIEGDELGEYTDIKELREKALSYYKKTYQGRTVVREGLGDVRFSLKGIDETTKWDRDGDRLKTLPALEKIILTGKIGVEEDPKHPRKDGIIKFIPVTKTIQFAGKPRDVEVLLGKDRQGKLFYELFLDNFRQKQTSTPAGGLEHNPGAAGVSNRVLNSVDGNKVTRLNNESNQKKLSIDCHSVRIRRINTRFQGAPAGHYPDTATINSFDAGIDRPVSRASYLGASNPIRINNSLESSGYEINIRFIGEDVDSRPDAYSFNQRIQNWRIDDDGMLRVTAHILREGIYDYAPEECPPDFRNLPVVKQYIPAAAFTPEALATLEGKWVIVADHEWRTDENTMTNGARMKTP